MNFMTMSAGAAQRNTPHHCPCGAESACGARVFLHAPKTGGETLLRWLGLEKDHRAASERRAEIWRSHKRKAFVFAVVRNPYARMFSWFRYCIHGHHVAGQPTELPRPHELCRAARRRAMALDVVDAAAVSAALEAWLHVDVAPFASGRLEDRRAEWLITKRQVDYLLDEPPPHTTAATATTAAARRPADQNSAELLQLVPHFVVRFERYDEDVRALAACLRAGGALATTGTLLDADTELTNTSSRGAWGHENGSDDLAQGSAGGARKAATARVLRTLSEMHWADALSNASRAWVRRHYEADFEFWQFAEVTRADVAAHRASRASEVARRHAAEAALAERRAGMRQRLGRLRGARLSVC